MGDIFYATLAAPWPVERPNDQPHSADIESCLARGWLYREDAGNGWDRIGLTEAGAVQLERWREDDEAWARAEFARIDARPRYESTGRLVRKLVPMACPACGRTFSADSNDLRPEGHRCSGCDEVSP